MVSVASVIFWPFTYLPLTKLSLIQSGKVLAHSLVTVTTTLEPTNSSVVEDRLTPHNVSSTRTYDLKEKNSGQNHLRPTMILWTGIYVVVGLTRIYAWTFVCVCVRACMNIGIVWKLDVSIISHRRGDVKSMYMYKLRYLLQSKTWILHHVSASLYLVFRYCPYFRVRVFKIIVLGVCLLSFCA